MLDLPKLVLRRGDVLAQPKAEVAAVTAAGPRPSSAVRDPVAWVDGGVLALLRCVLALSALGILAYGPNDSEMNKVVRLLPVIGYCIYSIASLLRRRDDALEGRWVHWVDVALYTWLLVVGGPSNGLLFHFFLFPIFVAGFIHAYTEGLRVTVVAVACLVVTGTGYPAPGGDLQATLVHATYLAMLGWMLVCMGGSELQLRRRLRFLHEVTNVWNPRFGVERTIALNLDRMVRFFGADSVLLLLEREGSPPGYAMYIATPRTAGSLPAANALAPAAVSPFLELPGDRSVRHVPPRLISRVADRLLELGKRRRAGCEALGEVGERRAP